MMDGIAEVEITLNDGYRSYILVSTSKAQWGRFTKSKELVCEGKNASDRMRKINVAVETFISRKESLSVAINGCNNFLIAFTFCEKWSTHLGFRGL